MRLNARIALRVAHDVLVVLESAEGEFVYDCDVFVPTEDITVILIGHRANFEWTIHKAELAAMR